VELAPALQADRAAINAADDRLLRATEARELLRAGFSFNPGDFGLADGDIDSSLAAARKDFETAAGRMGEFRKAGRIRLSDAIQLLRLSEFGNALPDAAQFQEASRELVYTLSCMAEIFAALLELRWECASLDIILRYRERGERGDHLTGSLDQLARQIRSRVDLIQQKIGQVRYPFHSSTERVLIGEYVRNKEYHPDPYELVLREGRSHIGRLFALYHRLLGALVTIAEDVERTMVGD
jgi:hypothetical protein